MADTRARVESVLMGGHDLLHDPDSWLAKIEKIRAQPTEDSSNQGTFLGRREHLFDYDEVAKLKDFNVHHSTCLEAKISTAFGLGHRNPRIHEVLDPLCEVSWQTTLDALGSDFFEFANAYLEVVRDEAGQIIKLFHLPAKDVWVYVEEHSNQYHYEIAARGNLMMAENLSGLRWARFGERDEFISRRNIATDMRKRVSEVIHFPMNLGRRSRHYGYPDWIPATPAMELDQCVTQYAFDFFFNGGMPEAIYTVAGQRMDPDDWEAIKKAFREHQGLGNRRKTMLINLAGTEIKAQLDKLTLDGQTTGENQKLVDDQALKIVSAHRVPPLLAGIQIPGKLGAANEMSNAIMAFQSLVISKVQKHFFDDPRHLARRPRVRHRGPHTAGLPRRGRRGRRGTGPDAAPRPDDGHAADEARRPPRQRLPHRRRGDRHCPARDRQPDAHLGPRGAGARTRHEPGPRRARG
jgi:hypothetical protein